ncbi:MAG: class I SAM-dependent methyltransferase [Terriglobales bacterium]|jgi:2-polyprenyl-3-methyl-5-hydroxy-6-metoxy-1,4-benzoquinol methylase
MSKTTDFREQLYSRYVSAFKGPRDDAQDRRWYRWSEYKLVPLLGGLTREAAILDLGCGGGQMLQLLKDQGFSNASGVDVSAEQVREATDRGLKATVGDVFDCLLGSRSNFDAITALDIVEHFDKSEQLPLFEAIYAALRPGGRLIIETPNGEGLFASQVIYGDLTHLTIFSEASLSQLLRLLGFEKIEFYETGPAPKDLKGRVRGLLWRIVKAAANAARIIESGETQRLWTKNLICCCRKPL